MPGLDSLELDVDKPARMIILDPRNNLPMKGKDGKEAYVDVYSSDSEIARKFNRQIKTARLRTRNPNAITGDKLEEEDVERLAALTSAWHLVAFDGETIELECTNENAKKLFANNKLQWLVEQIDTFAGSRANFSKASS